MSVVARFTAEDFKKVKAEIAKDKKVSNPKVAAVVKWSAETVRLVRKSRSFKQYREIASR